MRPAHLMAIGLGMAVVAAHGATQEELLSMSLDELVNLEVNIATGTPKSLRATPAATSIITATELEAMGAQDIDEALETEFLACMYLTAALSTAPATSCAGSCRPSIPILSMLVNGIPQNQPVHRRSWRTSRRHERLPGPHD
jgi:hypothetical protein